MSEEQQDERAEASPYADIQNPFIVGENGAQAEFMLESPEEMPNLSLGAKTLIEDTRMEDGEEKTVWVPAQVNELRIVSPFQPERENRLYLGDDVEDPNSVFKGFYGPQSHQPMLISLDLEKEMRLENPEAEEDDIYEYENSAVQRPPSIQSKMVFPKLLRSDTEKEPALEDILQIKENGIPLGAVGFGNKPLDHDGKYLDYKWDVGNLDIKHTFIVGESGSGKTVLLKRMALHLRDKENSPVLMTDVQGDLIQMILNDIAEVPEASDWQEDIDRLSEQEALESLQPFKLVIPVPKEGLSNEVKAFKKLAKKAGANVQEIGLRLKDLDQPSEMSYLFTTTSDYAAPLIDDALEAMIDNRDWEETVENLDTYLDNRLKRANGDDDVALNGTNYPQSSLHATRRGAIKPLKKYFDNHDPSQEYEDNPLNELQFEGTTIFYLDHLPPKEKVMYEMQMVKWLYSNRNDSWSPYVFIDEAHQIIPSKSPFPGAKDTFERLKLTFKRLAREGRKYNISFILSTQNPNDIDSIVNEQCHTRIVMKSSPKNARAAQLDKDELKSIASSFGKGQMFIKSPFNDTREWLRLHSYLPNVPHEDMDKFSKRAKKVFREQYK